MEENKSKLENNVTKELSDDELENVTGGENLDLNMFDTQSQVVFVFDPGDVVVVKEHFFSSPIRCVVQWCEVFDDPQFNCYLDLYVVKGPDGLLRRVLRDDIVNQAV